MAPKIKAAPKKKVASGQPKTFSLTVQNRLALLTVLPKEADVLTMRILTDLMMDLGLSEKEIKAINIRPVDTGGLTWDDSQAENKDIPIGKAARGVIRGALEKLDRDKKIKDEHLPLWDMFC